MATVQVRNRDTLAPVEGAEVMIGNTSLINPARPDTAAGTTDAEGEVTLRAAAYNRLTVRVLHPDYGTILAVGDHPASFGDSGWIGPSMDEDGRRARLEVRLVP